MSDQPLCGGIVEDQPNQVRASGKTYLWHLGDGSMYGINRQQTEQLITKAYYELSAIAGWEWEQTHERSKAKIRIEIHGNGPVMEAGSNANGKLYAFGKAWRSGRIAINKDRKVDFFKRRYLEQLIQHETLHVFDWDHSASGCVMHWGDYTDYFCPGEVRKAQAQFGKPERPVHPIDRILAGDKIRAKMLQIRDLRGDWSYLVTARSKSIEAGTWLEKQKTLQPRILALVEKMRKRWSEMAELNRNWHRINNAWKGVPGIVQLRN